MANSIATITGMIAKRSLAVLHSKLLFPGWINRQYSSEFAQAGGKVGYSVRVRRPARVTTTGGALSAGSSLTLSAQDFQEGEQLLYLNMWRGALFGFSSAELTMEMDDLETRFIEPVMSQVSSDIEQDVIAAVAPYVANAIIATGTTANSAKLIDVLSIRAKLSLFDAPEANRYLMLSPLDEPALVDEAQVRFNPADKLSESFVSGTLGEANGFVWGVSNRLPVITLPADIVCTLKASVVEGSDQVILTGLTDGQVVPVGAVISFTARNALQPETRQDLGFVKQFSIVAAEVVGATTTGECAITLNEKIYYGATPKKNISSRPVATDAVVFLGTASKSYRQVLLFQKDAFTMVSADMELPSGGAIGKRSVQDGISARVVFGFDTANSIDQKRFDVIYGAGALRHEWSGKILIATT